MSNITDKDILHALCDKLDKITRKFGVRIRIIEIKGTIYFFPELPPRPPNKQGRF